jgi:multiple sugar transport system permease protein
MIFFLLFVGWPLLEVFRLSLYETNFINSTYVGLKNYKKLLIDPAFHYALKNSFWYCILITLGQVGISVFISLLCFDLSKKWQDAVRIILYLPTLSAGIIIAQSWRWIFHYDGLLNWILSLFKIKPVAFFQKSFTAIPAISIIIITAGIGGYIIILLSAMIGIDKDIIQAAKIDGANWFQIKIMIILPMIKKIIGMITVLSVVGSFQIFETIYSLAPYEYSASLTYNIYREGFQFSNYGLASAQAVVLLFITTILMLSKNKLERSD